MDHTVYYTGVTKDTAEGFHKLWQEADHHAFSPAKWRLSEKGKSYVPSEVRQSESEEMLEAQIAAREVANPATFGSTSCQVVRDAATHDVIGIVTIDFEELLILVSPDWQRCGIASTAVSVLVHAGRLEGWDTVTASVSNDNKASQIVLDRLGFKVKERDESNGQGFTMYTLDLTAVPAFGENDA
ncbi:hypothetical protein Q5752_005090 [Cryptotrichosporon argae]